MAAVLLVGPWVPLSIAFARSLRRQGLDVYLLQAHAQNRLRGSFAGLRGSTTIPAQLSGTREGLELVKQYATSVGASVLVAVIDSELIWLGENRHEFEPSCRVLVQTPELLFRLQSKRHQLELASRVGLPVLPTYIVMEPDDADQIPVSDFPIVLRPDRPDDVEPGFKTRFVKSHQQLKSLIRESRLASPIIAQPFRRLPNLVIHGARAFTGEVIASRCYRVPRKFEDVTLAIEPCAFPSGLEERCHEFVRLAGITGCYHFEFLCSPSEDLVFFLEINVRLGGTTDKVVRTGFDEPRLLLETYGLLSPSTSTPTRGFRRVVNKRTVMKHIVWAAAGRLTALDYPDVGRLAHVAHSFRDLLVAKDSIFDWRDVSGSIRFHFRR